MTLSDLPFNADILIFSECRLNTGKPIPQLDDYNSFRSTFQLNQNDVVVVCIKEFLQGKFKEVRLVNASYLQLDVLSNTILCIYPSPFNTNATGYIESLSSHSD